MAQVHHVGTAGQLAVMSEIALLGYNVAIPEIDVGDDIFSVAPITGKLVRVQVKTALGKAGKKRVTYQFRVRSDQISTRSSPEMVFVFAMRIDDRWRFLVLKRFILERLVGEGLGTANGEHRVISLSTDGVTFTGARLDLTKYVDVWSAWPKVTNGGSRAPG